MELVKVMGKLYIMQGFARSGKSTVSKQWEDFEIEIKNGKLLKRSEGKRSTELPRVIVCADDIRLTFGFRYNWRFEDYVHAIENTMIKTLLCKHDVLVVETHTTKGSIIAMLNIDINAEFYRMDTSVAVCCERAVKTGQADLIPVIERHGKQLEALPPIDDIREEVKNNQSFKTVV